MKQKLIIGLSLVLLLTVIFLISRDLFTNQETNQENPTEYDLEKLKKVDSSLICYRETRHINPSLGAVNALALDKNSTIYVAGDNEVQVFNKNLQKVSSIKLDSSASCIAVSGDKLYAGIGNHVEVYNLNGTKLKRWNAYSPKAYITSIAVNETGVYIADAGVRLVYRCSAEGNLLTLIGKKDKSRGIDGFIIPSLYFDLAIAPDNELWVVNPGKHEITNFNEKGDFRTSWGVPSMQSNGFAGCCNPVQFCFLPDGKFVTCEKGLDRIKIHDQSGKFECYVAILSGTNTQALSYSSTGARIHDVAADTDGTIYVLDAVSKLVRIFEKK
jgi:sugar lactone lactonase YvrE